MMNSSKPSASSKRVILLLGPPGSGKGTQAATLASELSIPHISTGDLFRENMRSNTTLGQKVKGFIESGKLVPDDIVLEMLFDRVSTSDCNAGYLLDGFPRTIAQAEALANRIEQKSLIVINLAVPDDIIIKRAEGRLTCRNCGHIHNKYFSPPQVEGQCDKCGSELYQRSDDSLSVVEERLRVYQELSQPLLAYYKDKGLLSEVDGKESKEIVYEELKRIYEQKVESA